MSFTLDPYFTETMLSDLYPLFFRNLITSSPSPLFFLEETWKKELLKIIQQEGPRTPLQSAQLDVRHPELIFIHPSATIEPFVTLTGPCYVGPHALIRQGAYLRSNCFIGPHVLVGHSCEIKSSTLLANTKASHFAYIGDSLIGESVQLASRVTCANLRLDQNPVTIRTPERKEKTNLRKVGAFIGHHSFIGCHVVLNPGKYLPPHSVIPPPR